MQPKTLPSSLRHRFDIPSSSFPNLVCAKVEEEPIQQMSNTDGKNRLYYINEYHTIWVVRPFLMRTNPV
jgi:hypothetical protein